MPKKSRTGAAVGNGDAETAIGEMAVFCYSVFKTLSAYRLVNVK